MCQSNEVEKGLDLSPIPATSDVAIQKAKDVATMLNSFCKNKDMSGFYIKYKRIKKENKKLIKENKKLKKEIKQLESTVKELQEFSNSKKSADEQKSTSNENSKKPWLVKLVDKYIPKFMQLMAESLVKGIISFFKGKKLVSVERT